MTVIPELREQKQVQQVQASLGYMETPYLKTKPTTKKVNV
jgi:hypothetical protein